MRTLICLLILASLNLVLPATRPLAATADQLILIGAAKMDITPEYPVRLTGYASRKGPSVLPGLKIWAKALAIGSDADGPALLITVDNCGVGRNVVEEVAARLKRKANIARERIAVSSSHSHNAPQTIGFAEYIFVQDLPADQQAAIERYTRELTDKIEQVALDALKDRKPGRLFWSEGQVGFAANRRTKGGPVDHSVPVLCARDLDGKLRAVVANYACHCTTLGGEFNQTCGDWAGFAGEALERDNSGAVALVTIGCGADSNPSPRGGADFGLGFSKQHGQALAAQASLLLANPMTPLNAKPEFRTKRIELPFQPHFTRDQWEKRATNSGIVGFHAKKYLARLDRGEKLPATLPYLVQTWNFGDKLALVFLGGEVVVDYSLRLKREFDPKRLWVTAYANDVPCYIPSKRILTEGGYEAVDSLWYYGRPQQLAPETEDLIVATVHELLPKSFLFDEKRAEFPPPKSPAEALASMRTKPGLEVELVASEPLIVDPVAIDWGADGKLWVVEMRDYPMGMDGKWKPGGRVKFLEDLNGDGKFDASDRATVFLDDLPFPTGVTAWNKGVLVCAAPDIIYAEDTNGDGKADKVEKLFSGFYTDNYQARVNSLQLGLDGWFYGANGLLGGVIRGMANGKEVNIRGQDFRFKPDTREFEPASGVTQQGRVRDDFDNWFGCDNSTLLRNYPLPDHYLRRNPHVPAPDPAVFVPGDADPNQLFPISCTLARFNDLHTANRTTSACGLGIYRDDLLGAEFYGNAFICEPVHNLVHREVLTPEGITFKSHRAPDEKSSEFLASTDSWFRPAQVRTGPDGGLWVVDMYRFLIEHPRWIPADRLAKIDQRAGDDKGRIYRVKRKDVTLRQVPDLTKLNVKQLAAALDSPNGTERDRVHLEFLLRIKEGESDLFLDLFFEPTRKEIVHILLPRMLDATNRPAVIAQVASVLETVGELHGKDASTFMLNRKTELQRFGFQIFEKELDSAFSFPDPNAVFHFELPARTQIALMLGESKKADHGKILAKLLEHDFKDEWMRAALLSSATHHSAALLNAAIALPESPERSDLTKHLIATGAAASEQLEPTLAAILPKAGVAPVSWQLEGLTALLRAVERAEPERGGYAAEVTRLGLQYPTLNDAFAEARRLVEVGRETLGFDKATSQAPVPLTPALSHREREKQSPVVEKSNTQPSTFAPSNQEAATKTLPLPKGEGRGDGKQHEQRTQSVRNVRASEHSAAALAAAIMFLGQHPKSSSSEAQIIAPFVSAAGSESARKAALQALRRIDTPVTTALVLKSWSQHSPALRGEILSLLLSREIWVAELFASIERKTIRPEEVSLPDRQRLLQHSNSSLQAQARKFFLSIAPADRSQVVERYTSSLGPNGSSGKGAEVFAAACASCHTVRGRGHEVGPNLAALRDKDTAYWIKNILDPNAVIEPRFVSYQIETRDGRSLSGIVQAETSTSLTLAQANGIKEQILRNDLAEIRASGLSLMSEGLEQTITPDQMVDLLVYLRSTPAQFGSATTEMASLARERFVADGNNGFMYLFASAEKLPYPSWIGTSPLAICRQTDGRSAVKWQTRPVPHDLRSNSPHVFRVPAAMGFVSQPAGKFTLKLNDRPALEFDATLNDKEWQSADGSVRANYVVMESNDEDSNGVFQVAVSPALLQPGQSATLEVIASASGSQRWFGIYTP